MTISESLRKIADEVQDWDGEVHMHTHTVTSEAELKAWTRVLENPKLMSASLNRAVLTLYGDVGPLQVFVNYERGLLGEPALPKPEPEPKAMDAEMSISRLKELLA